VHLKAKGKRQKVKKEGADFAFLLFPFYFELSLRQPDVPQMHEVVAGHVLEALDLGPMGINLLPPEDMELIGLFIQHPFLKLPEKLKPLLQIGRAALLLIEVVQDPVLVTGIVERAFIAAQKL